MPSLPRFPKPAWLARWSRPTPAAAASFDDQAWTSLLREYPFAASVGAERLPRLRGLCEEFLASKRFAGAGGLVVDDAIGAAIALQACVPVIELGLAWYDDFTQIIVYPDQFLVPRRHVDSAGVVFEEEAWLAGEAMDGGPVVLSWVDVQAGAVSGAAATNVVIHEFVHKLDLRDGDADGVPPMPRARRARWRTVLETAYGAFVTQLDEIEDSIPGDVDPDSEAADEWFAGLPLDAYAAEDPGEFFAVAGECFFMDPDRLQRAFPELFHCFEEFFGLTPRASR